ncbi:MFS transporter, partial [Variovorax sp. HJSM1_2]|uniref:MFS transporter n=1 Tax=Variovorax sp. HJSM1_2 TaxID=3366263 RepID=UPI003BE3CAFB
VAHTQARWGRKASFQLGLVVAVASALLCLLAVHIGSFWLLCTATLVAGYYNANAGLYRFAAGELCTPAWREKAVSLVMAGGLLGAVAGPNLAHLTRDWLPQPFAAAYLALALAGLLSMAVLSAIEFPPPAAKSTAQGARSLGRIARQPVFIVAALTGALGYGVMNLLMASTPIAMQVCGMPFRDAALVLEWHVIGMFAPGFFTGHLIRRFGVLPVMAVGVLLYLGCISIALSGQELQQFGLALFLLGLGWNFLFTGSTTLSMQAYRPEERDKAQGLLNFLVFATLALSSLASGVLVTTQGWHWLNLSSLVPVLLAGASLAWLALQQRQLKTQR